MLFLGSVLPSWKLEHLRILLKLVQFQKQTVFFFLKKKHDKIKIILYFYIYFLYQNYIKLFVSFSKSYFYISYDHNNILDVWPVVECYN